MTTTPAKLESVLRAGVIGRAARTAKAETDARDLVADAEWILEDSSPALAMERLGYSNPGSLAQRLRRAGRDDLARPFWRLDCRARRAMSGSN